MNLHICNICQKPITERHVWTNASWGVGRPYAHIGCAKEYGYVKNNLGCYFDIEKMNLLKKAAEMGELWASWLGAGGCGK